MSKTLVKKIIKSVKGLGYMATIDGSTPRVRPMFVMLSKDDKLLTSTFKMSPKMKQLGKNQRVEFCFLDAEMRQVRFSGRIKVVEDAKKKKDFFKKAPGLDNYFESAEDPKYILLELKPTKVQLMQMGEAKYTNVKW